MEQIRLLFLLIVCSPNVKGLAWTANTISNSTCESNDIYLIWSYTLAPGETVSLTEWKKSRTGGFTNVADDFSGFQAASSYTGRLTRIGNGGIKMSNAAVSDSGIYYILLSIGVVTYNASATATVYANPNASCKPIGNIEGKKLIGSIPDACPVKSYSDAVWTVDGKSSKNEFECSLTNSDKTYKCCAEGAAIATCYSGQSLCIELTCPVDTKAIGGIVGGVLGAVAIIIAVILILKNYKNWCHGNGVNGPKDAAKGNPTTQHAAVQLKTPSNVDSEAKPIKTFDPSERRPLPLGPLPSLTSRNLTQPPDGGQQNLEETKQKKKKQKKRQHDEGNPETKGKAEEE